MKNQNKKTNYRLQLEKQFQRRNDLNNELIRMKENAAKELGEKAQGIYKLTEVELMSYGETEYSKAQKDLRKLEKMNNKRVKAFDFDTKDGQKMNVFIPQRLQFLNKESE